MAERKNARKTAFPASVNDYTIEHKGLVATITAKDFPEKKEFRIYQYYGDVNRLADAAEGVRTLLRSKGVEERTILLKL